MRLTDPRIAIVGSGAVGCFYGGRLLNSGLDVHFLMRSDLEHVAKEGLRIESKHYGDLFFPHPNNWVSFTQVATIRRSKIAPQKKTLWIYVFDIGL